uniref:hypothetical protein n=1 Tax=Flavobacterium sp. TaxID=239 RepID=UPI00404AA9ED
MKQLIFIFFTLFCVTINAQDIEITEYIKRESIGGKLDFTKIVEAQAEGAPFIRHENTLYSKKDFSILMWGAKVKSLGIENLETANSLWQEINKRDLTEAEKSALRKGFEINLEN